MSVRESGPRPGSGVRITAPAVINAAARSERFKHPPRSARRCRSGFLNPARITKLTPRTYVNAEQTEADNFGRRKANRLRTTVGFVQVVRLSFKLPASRRSAAAFSGSSEAATRSSAAASHNSAMCFGREHSAPGMIHSGKVLRVRIRSALFVDCSVSDAG